MTILFAGGEDVDFIPVSTQQGNNGNGALFRPAWSRFGLLLTKSGVADPPTNRFATPQFAATSDFWLHFRWGWSQNGLTSSNSQVIRFLDSSGVCRLLLRATGSTSQFKFSKRNAAGTFTDLVTGPTPMLTLETCDQIDIHVIYGASGFVGLYQNSTLVFSYTGDVTTDSATQLASVEFNGVEPTANNITCISEVIVATTDTRGMNLWTMNGTTAGAAQAWSGTAGNPNQTTNNDANFISSATAGQVQEYKTPTLAVPGGSYTVAAVVNSVRASKGASGPSKLDVVTRIAGTDYVSADLVLTTGFASYSNIIQSVNPATAAAWAPADLAASNYQYGVQSVA